MTEITMLLILTIMKFKMYQKDVIKSHKYAVLPKSEEDLVIRFLDDTAEEYIKALEKQKFSESEVENADSN